MRFQVVALVMLGAASVCGCIQAEPAASEESVGAAEQNFFSLPPTPTGFWFDDAFILPALALPALKVPSVKAQLALTEGATVACDDDDCNDDGDSR
jgi:hypothetical protein